MTVYRTIAFDQNTAAYHGGDAGWIRHANSGNLSRPSLEPDLSDLPLVHPVSTVRFGRPLRTVRHAPNVLGDVPLVMPISTTRFGRPLRTVRHAPMMLGVLGQFIDPSTVQDIAEAVQAASTIASTAYGLDQQKKATDAQKNAANAAQAQAAAAQAAAAAAANPTAATTTPTAVGAATSGAPGAAGASGAAGKGSNTLLYVVGGLVGVAVLALLLRRPSAAAK